MQPLTYGIFVHIDHAYKFKYPYSFLLILTLLWSRLHRTSSRSTDLKRHLLTLGLRSHFGHSLPLQTAFLDRPGCALLLTGVTLSHLLAFVFLFFHTIGHIIFYVMLVVSEFLV